MDEVLRMINLPLNDDENFNDTPTRFLKYLQSYTVPFDAADILGITFPLKHKSEDPYDRPLIVQVGIPYRAVCAHHLLPVLGTAHVGYIPRDRVVGLSKLARLVYGISHRLPSLQEDVCDEVTQALSEHLKPRGAMCVITAEHGCMSARGVEEATGCIDTVTTSVKGVFIEKHEARDEFYRMVDMVRK
jgi:GTP cyclohydrolase I